MRVFHGKQYQQDYRGGGKDQLGDQCLCLVIRGGSIVSGYRDVNCIGNKHAFQLLHTSHHLIGNDYCIGARFFRNRQGNRRVRMIESVRIFMPLVHMRDIAVWRFRPIDNIGNVRKINRATIIHAHHDILQLGSIGDEVACLNGNPVVVPYH